MTAEPGPPADRFHYRAVSACPGYWMCETSGALRPAVEAFLTRAELTAEHIAAMRAYLRQWAEHGAWAPGPELDDLRERIDALTSRLAIDRWIADATKIGMDPL